MKLIIKNSTVYAYTAILVMLFMASMCVIKKVGSLCLKVLLRMRLIVINSAARTRTIQTHRRQARWSWIRLSLQISCFYMHAFFITASVNFAQPWWWFFSQPSIPTEFLEFLFLCPFLLHSSVFSYPWMCWFWEPSLVTSIKFLLSPLSSPPVSRACK